MPAAPAKEGDGMNLDELQRQGITIHAPIDVLVTGGGTAGSVAAIAAAREGARTLLVEDLGFLGGTQTAALVTPQMPNVLAGEPLNAGIDLEIHRRLSALGESGRWKDGNPGWFNPEMLKHVLDDLVFEAGAAVSFFTRFEDVIMEDGRVAGIVVLTKSGRRALPASRIIDATGDGDVAAKAGVPFDSGDSATKRNQPFSVRFHLGNVDLARFAEYLEALGPADILREAEGSKVPLIHAAMTWDGNWPLAPVFKRAIADGVLRESDGNYFQLFTMAGRPGELAFNCPRISEDIDGTSVDCLSAAMRTGRLAIRRYVEFCRRYLPGCETAYLAFSAPMVGVRETRRIHGEYCLTTEDVLSARKFADAVARSNYPVDVHRNPGEKGGGLHKIKAGDWYEVPYRCLVPLQVENFLVAGRCLSASFEAQGSVRVQSNCRAMGQAAGLAAALSLRQGVSPRGLDGVALRRELVQRGARL